MEAKAQIRYPLVLENVPYPDVRNDLKMDDSFIEVTATSYDMRGNVRSHESNKSFDNFDNFLQCIVDLRDMFGNFNDTLDICIYFNSKEDAVAWKLKCEF